jgi:DNA-binding transcriptional LysR family regulator
MQNVHRLPRQRVRRCSMELRQLEAFVAAAEERNFSKAARRLRISQPPLSRRIQELEKELGVTLFRRAANGATLTPAGEALLPLAIAVVGKAADLQAAAGGLGAPVVRTTIKVGFTGAGLTGGMWELMNLIGRRHAGRFDTVSLEGYEMPSSDQLIALERGTIDVALSRIPTNAVHLSSTPLFRERIVVLLATSHPLASRKHVRFRDVAADVVLLNDTTPGGRRFIERISALAAARNVMLVFGSVAGEPPERAALLPVAAGWGISFGAMSPYTPAPALSGIVAVPLLERDATLEVRIAWRRLEPRAEVLAFVQSVRTMFRDIVRTESLRSGVRVAAARRIRPGS